MLLLKCSLHQLNCFTVQIKKVEDREVGGVAFKTSATGIKTQRVSYKLFTGLDFSALHKGFGVPDGHLLFFELEL